VFSEVSDATRQTTTHIADCNDSRRPGWSFAAAGMDLTLMSLGAAYYFLPNRYWQSANADLSMFWQTPICRSSMSDVYIGQTLMFSFLPELGCNADT